MWKSHGGVGRKGPSLALPAFEFPPAAALAAAKTKAKELKELAKWQKKVQGPTVRQLSQREPYFSTHSYPQATSPVPPHLAHLQVRVVAPHLDFNTIMESVPAKPGRPDSVDPFASPIIGMTFANFPVLKIGNIPYSCTKSEIAHFLGPSDHANLIRENAEGTPIHIIMERSTSKTMDCYVEMRTYDAVEDQIRRYWDMVIGGSNVGPNTSSAKPPRIGQRLISVEVSSADELLKDMFPRAKCVRWENGRPIIMRNDDPYSTGFTGYFTTEEMVGLARHAEHSNRSPFSMKCLQRTYECMISTLWKFPWAAASTYSIGDRNLLFKTYMKLLDALVFKVEQGNVAMLSQQLLLEYLFAGLNCRGFGERQRGLIHARGGRTAVPINVKQIHRYWPFEVVGMKIGLQDEEYCKTYLNIIEQGVQALGAENLMPKYFIFAPGLLPGGSQPPIRITFFEFNEKSQGLTFEAAIEIELQLMTKLLQAGYKKITGSYPGTYEEAQQQQKIADELKKDGKTAETYMAAHMDRLKEQNEELKVIKEDSPPQSPKGTFAPRDIDTVNTNNTPIHPSAVHRFADKSAESRRRVSEPEPCTGTLGAGLDISPMRASGSKAIPIKDPKTKVVKTPTKTGRRTSFAVRDIIHEENENEEH